MPMTKLQERARVKYVTVKEFQEQYSLSQAQAYKILSLPELQEAVIKTGPKNKKVNFSSFFYLLVCFYFFLFC